MYKNVVYHMYIMLYIVRFSFIVVSKVTRCVASRSHEFKTKISTYFCQEKNFCAAESGKKKKDVLDSFQIPSSLLSIILKQKKAILNATDTEGSRKNLERTESHYFCDKCGWFGEVKALIDW